MEISNKGLPPMSAQVASLQWAANERRKQSVLVMLAVLLGLALAVAPRNERRMFVFDGAPFALSAIAAPEETSLRSGIFDGIGGGYDTPFAGFAGPGRRGGDRAPTGGRSDIAGSPQDPSAFFGQTPPDSPFAFDQAPLFTNVPGLGDVFGFGDTPGGPSPIPGNPFPGSPPLYQTPPGGSQPPPSPPAVPEPASWAMMIGGMMMLGGTLRMRSAVRIRRAMA